MSPRVSVAMVTYRHQAFVAEAIESVLAQDLDDWELVVGDDASSDDTLEVVRSFAERCAGRLRILPHHEHIGPRANYIRTLEACAGEYVAQLDGDDAWCWPEKLRTQVEFLDSHPDHAWVFCASRKVFGDERDYDWYPPGRRARYELDDLAELCFAGSAAVLFRRAQLDLPPWFRDAPVGDWPLHALNARHGSIGYIDCVGVLYRQHAAGRWAGLDDLRQLRVQMATRDHIQRHLGQDLGPGYLRASLRDRVREIELETEPGAEQQAGARLLALLGSSDWVAHADERTWVKAARALERLGHHRDARRILGRLLKETAGDVPRIELFKRWMRSSVRSLWAPARS